MNKPHLPLLFGIILLMALVPMLSFGPGDQAVAQSGFPDPANEHSCPSQTGAGGGAEAIPARALGRRSGKAVAAVCVLSLWRRAETVHREFICVDGSNFNPCDDCAEISIQISRRASGKAAGFDYAAAPTRHPSDFGSALTRGGIIFRARIRRRVRCAFESREESNHA